MNAPSFFFRFRLIFIFVFGVGVSIFPALTLKAQNLDSLMGIQAKADPHEKLYFQFDKNYYTPGETIWFKTYVFQSSELKTSSKNLYIEIVNESGKIVRKLNAPIIGSMAVGSIPVNYDFPENVLVIRAYTIPMLNGDTGFLYTKAIPIIKPDTKIESLPQRKPENTSPAPTATFSNKEDDLGITLGLYPEGGDLVEDILSIVAFRFKDRHGFPYQGQGKVLNDKGEVLTTFNSVHNGMGTFGISPRASEKYWATWSDPQGIEHKTPFPKVLNQGAILRISSVATGKRFTIARTKESAINFKTLYLIGSMHQRVVYQARINLNIEQGTTGVIPTQKFPTGVLQITLLDADLQPIAERICFVNNQESVTHADISIPKINKAKRALNEGIITVPSNSYTNLSVSVTDADLNLSAKYEDNLITHILLTTELRGKILNPYYYFQNNSDSVAGFLDLVCMTHGWRKFNWELLLRGRAFEGNEKESNYLSFNGKIAGLGSPRDYAGTKISFMIRTVDSATNFLSIPLSNRGELFSDGLIFYDFAKIYYQSIGTKFSFDKSQLYITNGLLITPNTANINPENRSFIPFTDPNLTEKINLHNSQRLSVEYSRSKNQYTLKELVIKTKAKSSVKKLDEEYATGIFSGSDARSFDVQNDPFAKGSSSVFQYLQSRVPGLQISNTSSPTPSLTWRGSTPTLYLDGSKTDASLISSINLSNIAYIKVFDPGSAGVISNSGGGVIAIFTKKGGGDKVENPGMALITLAGYSPYKEFSAPDYASELSDNLPDVRSTIYWNSTIVIEEGKHVAHFKFYNNDISRHFRIVLEGVNAENQLIHQEKLF